MDRFVLHEDPRSGNCYKIRLTAALLGLKLERRKYDIIRGDTRVYNQNDELVMSFKALGMIATRDPEGAD